MFIDQNTRRTTRRSSALVLEEAVALLGSGSVGTIVGALSGKSEAQQQLSELLDKTRNQLVDEDEDFGIAPRCTHFIPEAGALTDANLDDRLLRWVKPDYFDTAPLEIERYWLPRPLTEQGDALRALARRDRTLADDILAARLRAALNRLKATKHRLDGAWRCAVGCLEWQWKLLILRTAYLRMDLIRNASLNPTAPLPASNNYKYVGRTFEDIVGGPAALVAEVMDMALSSDHAGLSDAESIDLLVRRQILSSADSPIVSAALAGKAQFAAYGPTARKTALSHISAAWFASYLAQLTAFGAAAHEGASPSPADVWFASYVEYCAGEGDGQLSRLTFVEARYGLTIHEAAAFVALQMLQAFIDVERLLDRELNLRSKPGREHPSKRQVMIAAELLRALFSTDAKAKRVDADGRSLDLDPARKNGSGAYDRMKCKLERERARITIPEIQASYWI